MKKILTIEKALNAGKKKGVKFLPLVPYSLVQDYLLPEYIELRFPGGKNETRKATLVSPRLEPAELGIQFMIYLKSGRREDFPMGTEVWAEMIKMAD